MRSRWRIGWPRSVVTGSSVSGFLGRVVGEELVECLDGAFEVGQVVVDRCSQNGVCGVEVPVCEVVAHPGDLLPGDGWLGGEQVVGECLDGLADL